MNCMIPIGKQALIEGKLKHTNEILVCLGEGYFVKYSAAQAIELTKRRIKRNYCSVKLKDCNLSKVINI